MQSLRSFRFYNLLSMTAIAFFSLAEDGENIQELSGLVGDKIKLPCVVDTVKCGEIHNLKWYRDSSRVYIFSEKVNISRSEGTCKGRAYFEYTSNGTPSYLVIKRLELEDEGLYKCEITYLEVNEGCKVAQFVRVVVLVEPKSVKIYEGNSKEVRNETMLGPFIEGDEMTLLCESGSGKPVPTVEWWNGSSLINGTQLLHFHSPSWNPVGVAKNIVRLKIGRGDVSSKYECRVSSTALVAPLRKIVGLDVNVGPLKLELTGVSDYFIEGTEVKLQCSVTGARPPANITWYNGSLPVESTTTSAIQSDGTYETESQILFNISRFENGKNFTCEATSLKIQKESPLKKTVALNVFYPPGPATLGYSPQGVVKGGSVQLTCSVDDLGRPDNTSYAWLQDGHYLSGITQNVWTINPATPKTQGNYTCMGVNFAGDSKSATRYIEVLGPPTFVEKPPPYYGALVSAKSIVVTCQVECYPTCYIVWLRNGSRLDTFSPLAVHRVTNIILPSNPETNLLQSVVSKLIWKMVAWPGGRLDRVNDNADYTCLSSGNIVGGSINTTTVFRVEYPPENLSLTKSLVSIVEGNVPEQINCSALANPEASYKWMHEDSNEILMEGRSLTFTGPIQRKQTGKYFCEAYNQHGKNIKEIFINVLYKPQCTITQTELGGKLILICTAEANPVEVNFTWTVKNKNETITKNVENHSQESILTLERSLDSFTTYLCYANNTVGQSTPCEYTVTGSMSWWKDLEEHDRMLFVIALLSGLAIIMLLSAVVSLLMNRNKQSADKNQNPTTEQNPTPVYNPENKSHEHIYSTMTLN